MILGKQFVFTMDYLTNIHPLVVSLREIRTKYWVHMSQGGTYIKPI